MDALGLVRFLLARETSNGATLVSAGPAVVPGAGLAIMTMAVARS
jgi:hypothetical protein